MLEVKQKSDDRGSFFVTKLDIQIKNFVLLNFADFIYRNLYLLFFQPFSLFTIFNNCIPLYFVT